MNRLAGLISVVILACVPVATWAVPIHWKSTAVHLSVEGKPLREVLRDFTASEGVPATIAQGVDGTVTGNFDMAPRAFLDALASSFGFVWYYDGTILEIVPASDMRSYVIKLDHASMNELRTTLDKLSVSDSRFPIQFDDLQRTAIVSGTPHYVQLVSDIATRLDNSAARLVGTQISVFKLHHAWAADHDIDVGGKTVTIPGVASVLRSMFRKNDQRGGAANASQTVVSPSLSRVGPMSDVNGSTAGGSPLMPPLPTGYAGTFAGAANTLLQPTSGQPAGPPSPYGGKTGGAPASPGGSPSGAWAGGGGADSFDPVIEANPATNSVLIRDLPERMDQYGDVIAQLDVRPRLIEIAAHIIEIDSGALQQIGVDWRAHNSHIDFQTGNGKTAQNSFSNGLDPQFGTTNIGQNNTTVAATPAGVSLTAVLGDAGRYLLARVNALEDTNQARIDASPKVTTLDNIEAVMDAKQQIFVRVQGYTAGDLYSISTGVLLRVLPMVVEENGKTQIKLEVSIEDGQFSQNQSVDAIPVVQTSQINTQAFVPEGQSLLIAGYRNDQSMTGVSGIPVLSKIPILGALFRYHQDNRSHMEQLFLLTPRIIDLD